MSDTNLDTVFASRREKHKSRQEKVYSLTEYLALCSKDPGAYASAPERLLKAIGKPKIIDTSRDPQLSRIFGNRKIAEYPGFSGFYGMEDTIANIVSYLRHSAQGLEESKQILYLLGPVGGGKSSLAERLKALMQQEPFYTLAVERDDGTLEVSPVNDDPLCLFNQNEDGAWLQEECGINPRYLRSVMSPWAVKRLEEFEGDETRFKIVKRYPSIQRQIAISKTEPGDENNQDISALVGKVDIRQVEEFSQDDTDAYSYSGGLCKGNRGLMEFVEMFKAPIKVLHPLLTATQERNYTGTEAIGGIPFTGIVLAHSNESEWSTFRGNKNNEAFLDRVYVVKVPYCTRVSREVEIYKKLLADSELAQMPCAPQTLEMLAQFCVLTRLKQPENSNIFSKMRVYDGENLKDKDPKAKSIQEYREHAGLDEAMDGVSTRFAFKTLAATFNYNAADSGGEIAANPIHLMYVLEDRIKKEQLAKETTEKYLGYIKQHLAERYREYIKQEIQTAYQESYGDYGQNMFDRYVLYADMWAQDNDYRDPDTGEVLNRAALEKEMEKLEKPSGIANVRDFRNEVVNFVLRARANNGGNNPSWTSYEKMRSVIEKRMFGTLDEILPVISFNAKANAEDQKRHQGYVERMMARGYTQQQIRLVSEWVNRSLKPG